MHQVDVYRGAHPRIRLCTGTATPLSGSGSHTQFLDSGVFLALLWAAAVYATLRRDEATTPWAMPHLPQSKQSLLHLVIGHLGWHTDNLAQRLRL